MSRLANEAAANRIPALDGVRGLAVLLVVAFHSRRVFQTTAEIPLPLFRFLGLGWSGVDLFFVLSGFLITGILLDTRDSLTYFRTFYIRRVLRIFPLYFSYLFLILVVARYATLLMTGRDPWAATNPLWFLTYLMNWSPGHGIGAPYLEHLWSLGIEEQFYLVWPAVIWLVPRRKLTWVCLGVAACAFACRVASPTGNDTEALYRLTTTRMDGMALGAFAALGLRDFRDQLLLWSRRLMLPCMATFVIIGMVSPHNVWTDTPMRTVGATVLVIAYACLVARASAAETGGIARFFRRRWMRTCGKYSYAIYVAHWPLSLLLVALWNGPLALALAPRVWMLSKYLVPPVLAASSFGVARLSWIVLERPFLRWKDQFAYPPPDDDRRYAGATLKVTA